MSFSLFNVYPVHDMLEQTVRDYGHRPAFDFLGKKWKWAEIGDLAPQLAAQLGERMSSHMAQVYPANVHAPAAETALQLPGSPTPGGAPG